MFEERDFRTGATSVVRFAQCEPAPRAYVPVCSRGIGSRIAAHTLDDPDLARELCELSSARHRSSCFEGVAKHLVYYLDLKANEAGA
jgi:hypothetical protein